MQKSPRPVFGVATIGSVNDGESQWVVVKIMPILIPPNPFARVNQSISVLGVPPLVVANLPPMRGVLSVFRNQGSEPPVSETQSTSAPNGGADEDDCQIPEQRVRNDCQHDVSL
jgi:hypothetical protein